MVLSNLIVDITISSRSFVFSQSDVQIPAGLTNISGLAVAGFDLINHYQRITLESWFANLEKTPLNRCQQLPAPYKRLIADNNKTDK